MKLLATLACCLSLLAGPVLAQQALAVQVPTAGLSSAPVPLQGWVFSPDGPGPHPAVVMVHGCGGAFGRGGQLNARHSMWGEYLAARGYVALMLDSFSARGIQQLCTIKHRERTLDEADRVGDAYAGLAFLRQLPAVDPRRIALLGWSHGGSVTLDAISQQSASAPGAGFAAAVAFYPACRLQNRQARAFHPYAPLLLLIGEADDWTPVAPCQALAAVVAARGEPMQIVTYPDTYHDFDNPSLKGQRLRKDVPTGVNPGVGVTTAPNVQAREDAKQRVNAFFAEHLK